MKEEQLLEGLKKAVPEGVELDVSKLDIKGLNTFVNDDTNAVVASKKEGFMAEGRQAFLTEKGFKDVAAFDDFKSTAESSDNELKKKYTKLEGDYNTLKSDHEKLNITMKTDKQINQLTSTAEDGLRVNPKYAKFVHSEISVTVAEAKKNGKELSFEDAAKAYLTKNEQYQLPIKNGTRHKQPAIKTADDVNDFYAKRYGNRKNRK